MPKSKITFFGSTEIVRVERCRKPETPVVCHICKQVTKHYVIFGERSVGACCFSKIEREIFRRMPDLVEWITKIIKNQRKYIEFRTKILNDLIDSLDGITGITFEPKPTNQITGFHTVDESLGNDLFDSGSGRGYCSDESPTIKCYWCGKTQRYNGNDSILYTNFADCQVLTCCWPAIEKSTFHLLPQIMPWFLPLLQAHVDRTHHLKYWFGRIKEIVNKND